MFRAFLRVAAFSQRLLNQKLQDRVIKPSLNNYHCLASVIQRKNYFDLEQRPNKQSLLQNQEVLKIAQDIRPLTKFSLKKGKRKTVKPVLKRFYRLNWGIWIRTKAGRHKRLWKKSSNRKRRIRQHVFVNATQAHLLDKMVTSFWKKPKYYVDDPYEPYHEREEFRLTRRKPL